MMSWKDDEGTLGLRVEGLNLWGLRCCGFTLGSH